jgi:hypothetical protein
LECLWEGELVRILGEGAESLEEIPTYCDTSDLKSLNWPTEAVGAALGG